MSNPFNGCPMPPIPGCPYQAEDGYNDRNRYPHGHLFVGEIENGKRYPFGVYTKEESDERYAVKQTEADVAALNEEVGTKAAQADLAALTEVVSGKADESEAVEIRARLDALEYQDIKINSFSAAPSVSEMGSSQTINLAWSLNKTATSQNINGITVTGTTKQYSGVMTGTSYTLNVSDGQTSASRTVSVSFANRIYYGTAADLSGVTALTGILSNDPERTITVDAGVGEYIIYAIPARLGDVEFYVGGFEGGFETPETQTLTNGSGYQESYKVYRSTRAGLGDTTIEIREV